MPLSAIREIEEFSYLRELAEEYQRQNGAFPFALSHWDPSDHTMKVLLKDLRLPQPPLPVRYIYSYYLDFGQQVLERLGLREAAQGCFLVPAGTNAMLLAIWWLKSLNIDRLIVLCPAYFPVFYASDIMGLPHTKIYIRRHLGKWQLPQDEIIDTIRAANSKTAVWVTNPVYCAGEYLCDEDTKFLKSLLLKGVIVIVDECLAITGQELCRKLSGSEHFLGIYSPHKSVCINAAKFAALVFDNKHQQFFDRWADVLVGGLSASSHSAISHFLGDNFLHFESAFLQYVNKVRASIRKIIHDHNVLIETDENSVGHFMTCYISKVPGSKGNCKPFLHQMVMQTGVHLIPGVRNHFDPGIEFNFRINLARECPQFSSALHRIIEYFSTLDVE